MWQMNQYNKNLTLFSFLRAQKKKKTFESLNDSNAIYDYLFLHESYVMNDDDDCFDYLFVIQNYASSL